MLTTCLTLLLAAATGAGSSYKRRDEVPDHE